MGTTCVDDNFLLLFSKESDVLPTGSFPSMCNSFSLQKILQAEQGVSISSIPGKFAGSHYFCL